MMNITRKKYNIKRFTQRFLLTRNQRWLEEKESELLKLEKECINESELNLVYSLLNRFTFLKIKDISKFFNNLRDKILFDWKCDEGSTKIIGFSREDEPDSSHEFIVPLKTILSGDGWNNGKGNVYFTHFARSFKKIRKQNYKECTIILIDEFIGTGTTVKNRLETIEKELPDIKYNVKICVLACMQPAIEEISRDYVELFCPHILNKGIKDHFDVNNYNDAKNNMDRLESDLAKEINGTKLPNWGHGGAEALYVREDQGSRFGNTPNSVFPIFWWSKYLSNSTRYPLLKRALNVNNK